MHSAPSVSYPVGRSRFEGMLLLALSGIGVLAGILLWSDGRFDWRQGVFVSVFMCCGVAAAISWWCSPLRNLRWDGVDWTLLGDVKAQANSQVKALTVRRVSAVIDFQHWLLLRIEPWHGRSSWRTLPRLLWLERRLAPADWDDLRRAVYSRARIDALREPEERLRATSLS